MEWSLLVGVLKSQYFQTVAGFPVIAIDNKREDATLLWTYDSKRQGCHKVQTLAEVLQITSASPNAFVRKKNAA